MSGMRRSDRKDSSDDNASKNLHVPQHEPTSNEELKQRLTQANSKRIKTETERDRIQSELEERNQSLEKKSSELVHVQQAFQAAKQDVETWQEKSHQNHQLYFVEQQNHQQTLGRYEQEKAKSTEWIAKYEAVEAQRDKYITLYDEAQTQLKYERRSKAGIKGWETRRKQENQRLKQEIGELAALVRESLSREDKALESLSLFADRMDKIQTLVNSVEGESPDNPLGLLQKIKLILRSIRDIMSE